MFKMLLVTSSVSFYDQFEANMTIFRETNFKISNLRLAVLLEVVLIKKSVFMTLIEACSVKKVLPSLYDIRPSSLH